MSAREHWILVRSMDELFQGCAVRVIDCRWCDGGSHLGTVMSAPVDGNGLYADGTMITETAVLTTIFCGAPPCVGIRVDDIATNTVFRLRPDETADESTASKRTLVPAEAR